MKRIFFLMSLICGVAASGYASMVDWDRVKKDELQTAVSQVASTGQASAQGEYVKVYDANGDGVIDGTEVKAIENALNAGAAAPVAAPSPSPASYQEEAPTPAPAAITEEAPKQAPKAAVKKKKKQYF